MSIFEKDFKVFLQQNKLLLPKQANNVDFLDVMQQVFSFSCLFGVAGRRKYSSYIWTAVILCILLCIEGMAIWKVIRALIGIAVDTVGHRSIAARFAGTLFYTISIISLLMASKLFYNWKNLSAMWARVERTTTVQVPADKTLKRRMFIIAGFMLTCSLFEHFMDVTSTIGFDCPTEMILKRYVLLSHGFIIRTNDYSEWFAIPLGVTSTIATLLWNFPDLLIVLISVGLASRYRRLNLCLARVCALDKKESETDKKLQLVKLDTWRKLREAYVKQAKLVQRMDEALGGIIVLSCFSNFYFICLQLFLGITLGTTVTTLKRSYYFVSLSWLCIRVSCVVLAASDINVQSQLGLKHIYTYDTNEYNIEVERLQAQLTTDYIALSGMGFFYLNKNILLQMAGAIITYELVLIQFDNKGTDTENIQLNDFLPTLNSIFRNARYIRIASYGLTISFSFTLILFLMLLALEACAIWKIIKLLTGLPTNVSSGLIGRLSGSIFYGNALISLLLSSKFANSWKNIHTVWLNTECAAGLNFTPDARIKKRTIFVTCMVASFALVEHMLSMMSATDFNCPPEEYFERYILSSHGFVLQSHEYSLWYAVPIFILSKLATALWNFQDLIIILISMGLTSRYHRLNLYVHQVIRTEKRFRDKKKYGTEFYLRVQKWRRLREAYVRHATLVRMVDRKLGALVLLSNINNLYFILLQLFFGIHKEKGSAINRAYYLLSLGWLLFRACSVVLAAADVHRHSSRALKFLYSCPSSAYNVEIKRLMYQLSNDYVALTGLGFFSLRRELLLEVAAAIIKYELVLIQFDT